MNTISIIGIILIISVISLLIKNYSPEYSILINIATGIFVIAMLLNKLIPVIEQINGLLACSKIPKEYGTILFKCFGICIIAQFASDACRDAGEISLAAKVEWIGKTSIIIIAFSLFEKIIQVSLKLMGG